MRNILLLNGLFLIYSVAGIFSKLASKSDFLSLDFVLCYGIVILILLIYALVWQQLLKRMQLIVMFANKSIVMVWGILWGALIFDENLKWGMLIGIPLIFAGIWFVMSDKQNK